MTIENVSQGRTNGLPQGLIAAQMAIQLPEVQEMLRRLSEYNLGIFMPHMHDELTGEFQSLPDSVIQVESGLEVSFRPVEDIANKTDLFLPVAWVWQAGAAMPSAVCEMDAEEEPGNRERRVKHKMPKGN